VVTDTLQNPVIEHAALATILRDSSTLDQFAGLEPPHFYDAEMREIYSAALDLQREGRPVNLVTLRALTGSDPLGGTSIADRLGAVSFDGVTPTPRDMADALIDLARRRELKALADHLGEAVLNMATKPATLAEMAMRECDRLLAAEQPAGRTYWPNPEGIDDTLRALERDDAGDILATGLSDLDRMAGGLHRRGLVYMAGRPGMGKSTAATTIATNVAKAGHGVLFLSLEMPRRSLDARRISAATYRTKMPILYSRALNRQMSPAEHEHFVRIGMSLTGLPIATDERSGLSMIEIATRVRKTRQEFADQGKRLGLVVVDHVGKVRPRDHRAPMVDQLGQVSNDLATLAKSEDVAMLALHQLNRSVESREDKRPYMSDLRASGNLEQDADGVWLLFRPAYYLRKPEDSEAAKDAAKELQRQRDYEAKKHVIEIIADKTRNGETGTVTAFCDIGFNVIDNLDRRHN
jgi:replicative DNA helicase